MVESRHHADDDVGGRWHRRGLFHWPDHGAGSRFVRLKTAAACPMQADNHLLAMANQLEQLKALTTVVADTGDFNRQSPRCPLSPTALPLPYPHYLPFLSTILTTPTASRSSSPPTPRPTPPSSSPPRSCRSTPTSLTTALLFTTTTAFLFPISRVQIPCPCRRGHRVRQG